MSRPTVWEPEDCVFPQDRLVVLQILLRKMPNGSESWDGVSRPTRISYSVALVLWDGEPRLAYRYDGDEEHPNGWPSSNSYPSWDIVPRSWESLLMPIIPIKYHAQIFEEFRQKPIVRVMS